MYNLMHRSYNQHIEKVFHKVIMMKSRLNEVGGCQQTPPASVEIS